MLFKASALAALTLVLQSHSAFAFFRLATSVLVTERADPLISPGKTSAHVHSISGGFNFATSLTYEALRKSNCTSSGVKEDSSAYWTPIVYFWLAGRPTWKYTAERRAHPTSGIRMVLSLLHPLRIRDSKYTIPTTSRMELYRFQRVSVIAGSPFARSYKPPAGVDKYTYYDCLDYKTCPDPGVNADRSSRCPYEVRMNVFFPECGDRQTDSADRSHVVYKVNGKCPATHPYLYPRLHYELYFSNKENPSKGIVWADGMNPSQPFVLSNGDPTGYGAHGDFFNGWQTDVLRSALKDCTGAMGTNLADGRAETCSHFTIVDGSKCKKKGDSPDLGNNERVSAWVPELPGCVPVTYTDAEALAAKPVCKNVTPSSKPATSTKQSSTLVTKPTAKSTSISTSKQSATTTSKVGSSTSSKPVTATTSKPQTSACTAKTVTLTKTVTVTASATMQRRGSKHSEASH
ncbi:hypothetical protein P389DRAFT_178801 [Cystobasidium minutum MCA 4210]|uniref:uncharacterized protein n=1 Tax=Cystobasidium minutum MCA 4210 TaxID=1397322 RepID=UPI0034CDE537|eukprot:jgi/Rhomi1/178801/fgenesh1_pg.3_\